MTQLKDQKTATIIGNIAWSFLRRAWLNAVDLVTFLTC